MLVSKMLAILLLTFVNAAPADDMQSLRTSCENTANTINGFLNNTAAMNTSDLVQLIVWQLGASVTNLDSQTPSSTVQQSSNATESLDSPYFDYIDSILTLSEALIRRGQASHEESNLSVFNTIQSLASLVQAYRMRLGNANMISRSATIRTLTAGSSLVDAESLWANSGSLPSKRKAK